MRGLKAHLLHMNVLEEVVGLDLSNFNRQVKMNPQINNDHNILFNVSNYLWFRNDEISEVIGETSTRRKDEVTEAQLEALNLRTKPEANKWLHLTPRIGALGPDAFVRGPTMTSKIHQYWLESLDQEELRTDKATKFKDRIDRKTLEMLSAQNVQGTDGHVRTDSMLKGW